MEKIKSFFSKLSLSNLAYFVIGWVILFDLIGGTAIPLAFGKGCGWFAVPNLIIDIYVIVVFVKRIKNEGVN